MKKRRERRAPEMSLDFSNGKSMAEDSALFEQLRLLRKSIADESHWPAYVVMSDKSLHALASLTDIITRAWSGKTTKQYKQFKGLKKESLRDNMTNLEPTNEARAA